MTPPHRHDWLALLDQQGLVVSPWVLDELGLFARQPPEAHAALRAACPDGRLPSLDALAAWLAWPTDRYVPAADQPWATVDVPEHGPLRADAALVDAQGAPLLLVRWEDAPLDAKVGDRWAATRQERFERLLLGAGVPHGVHVGPDHVRLVVAPAGEAAGWLDFPLDALLAWEHRVLVDALASLLGAASLFGAAPGRRTTDLLVQSRARQEGVTARLAVQVEGALRELLRGFSAADARTGGALLAPVPDAELYEGLITVLLRLVFLLYAEDRGLLPIDDPLYAGAYAVAGLAARLAEDAVAHGPAMDDRYGAWAGLLATWRVVWRGVSAGSLHLPPREGDLFDPLRFPFLEGRRAGWTETDRGPLPRVSDGVVHRVLERLTWLDGVRLSYRNLEVEQIGSVYESLMGLQVIRASQPGVWLDLAPDRPVWLDDLRAAPDALMALAGMIEARPAKLRDLLPALTGFTPSADPAADRARLHAALDAHRRGPPIAPGEVVLASGSARRRSGSHYTPRALSEPVVERTLSPALAAQVARRRAAATTRHNRSLGQARRRAAELVERRTGRRLDVDDPAARAVLAAEGFTLPAPPAEVTDERPLPADVLGLRVVDPAMGSGAFLAAACRWLAAALLDAWARTGTTPADPRPDLLARRLVAEQCLYGVDKNPMAVTLGRVSLWLETSAAELPLTFLNHNLRPGDAVVGLDLARLAAMDVDPSAAPTLFSHPLAEGLRRLARATRSAAADKAVSGEQIGLFTPAPDPAATPDPAEAPEADDPALPAELPRDASGLHPEVHEAPPAAPTAAPGASTADHILQSIDRAARDRATLSVQPRLTFGQRVRWLKDADDQTWDEGRIADAVLGAVWLGGTKKEVQRRLADLRRALLGWYPATPDAALPTAAQACVDALDAAGLRPLHWELAFPEVFAREDGGFDAVIGNPPFAGQETIRQANGGASYISTLQALWPEAHGNSDLVAYFFRRAASIVRPSGHFGLIATNTVAQGNTRDTGLGWIVRNDRITLTHATLDRPWPGQAAVVVSVVHGTRGDWHGPRVIVAADVEKEVEHISASLSADGEFVAPTKLHANEDRAFEGTKVYGQGFVLTPAEAAALIDADPRNGAIIKPYIGGAELNNELPGDDGYVRFTRYVIDFGDRSLEACEAWPALLAIVRAKVKPERDTLNDNPDGRRRKAFWWQFGRRTPALSEALRSANRCFAMSQVSKHHLICPQSPGTVFSHAAIVFAFDDWPSFAILQSRVHEAWARHAGLGSTMKTDARYTPSTCFETFPFPRPDPAAQAALAATGAALDGARTAAMRALGVGMTGVWNALLDPLHRAHHAAEVVALRAAREAMDAAALAAYGWSDLAPDDTAGIVRRLRALNAERAREEAAAVEAPGGRGRRRR